MHELSLSSAIVDTVIRHAGRSAGDLRAHAHRRAATGSSPTSLAFYFDIVARDTVCEGARLEQEFSCGSASVRRLCTRMGDHFPIFLCHRAGPGATWRIVTGEEFEVESIDVEEVAECTASR